MSFDSVIFDIDGTLWDASVPTAEGFSRASRQFEFGPKHFSRESILKELGKPLSVIFEDLYPEIRLKYSDENFIRSLYNEIAKLSKAEEYAAIEKYGGTPYPNLKETLSELNKKVPLFIVSNCEKGYIELFIRKTGTDGFFSDWLCHEDTGKDKDYNIGLIKEKYGLKKTCYAGDIANDALCSKKAGVPFIWAAYGFGDVAGDLYYRKINEFREIKDIIIG